MIVIGKYLSLYKTFSLIIEFQNHILVSRITKELSVLGVKWKNEGLKIRTKLSLNCIVYCIFIINLERDKMYFTFCH